MASSQRHAGVAGPVVEIDGVPVGPDRLSARKDHLGVISVWLVFGLRAEDPAGALVFVDSTCPRESRREPSLKIRVDVLLPAGPTATCPVMRSMRWARGFPGTDRVDAYSSCFLMQSLF